MKYLIYALYAGFGIMAGILLSKTDQNMGLIALAGMLMATLLIILDIIVSRKKSAKGMVSPKLLDTSVIIDGRVKDICRTAFLEGTLIVPKFVLHELQFIADSQDTMKRAKGRRGLDLLNDLKKTDYVNVEIVDTDYPELRGVDQKLVKMAAETGAKIITNDFNLNKIAEIQGVKVLNINDLTNSVKASFMPGEKINVRIMKEGKEKEQGIAYMPDGTMIVVDGARRLVNKRLDVTVTNVLQTDAGRMIFARADNAQHGHHPQGNENRVQGVSGDNRRLNDRNRNSGRKNNRGGFFKKRFRNDSRQQNTQNTQGAQNTAPESSGNGENQQ